MTFKWVSRVNFRRISGSDWEWSAIYCSSMADKKCIAFLCIFKSSNIIIMEQFLFRKATLADMVTLRAFEQKIISAERPFDETLDEDPISYYDLRELVQLDNALVLLAEMGSKVIGSGFGHIRTAKPYLDHSSYTHLGFMYTDPDY